MVCLPAISSMDNSQTDNVRNNWCPEQEYNLCKVDLRGQVLGYEDNVYFINCSIHLAQWIFIVPSIFLSSFCSETFNNWIYILMSTLILRGWKNMSESAKWFDWLALIHDFLRNNWQRCFWNCFYICLEDALCLYCVII